MVASGLLIASYLYLLVRVILHRNSEGRHNAWAIFLFLAVGGTAVAMGCAYVRWLFCLDLPAAAAGILFSIVLMVALPKSVALDRRLLVGLCALLAAGGGGLWEARREGRSCLDEQLALRENARQQEILGLKKAAADSVLAVERVRRDSVVAASWTEVRKIRYEDSFDAKTGEYVQLTVERNSSTGEYRVASPANASDSLIASRPELVRELGSGEERQWRAPKRSDSVFAVTADGAKTFAGIDLDAEGAREALRRACTDKVSGGSENFSYTEFEACLRTSSVRRVAFDDHPVCGTSAATIWLKGDQVVKHERPASCPASATVVRY